MVLFEELSVIRILLILKFNKGVIGALLTTILLVVSQLLPFVSVAVTVYVPSKSIITSGVYPIIMSCSFLQIYS